MSKKDKGKVRDSNLEILRIVSMLLIIGHHYSIYGSFSKEILLSTFFVDFLAIGGKVGVICFMLITGYFTFNSSYKPKKLFQLILQTWMYSFGILIVLSITGLIPFSKQLTLHAIFPIIYKEYWFMTGYVIVYLLSPYLNELVKKMEKQKFESLMTLLFLLFIFINTFFLSSLGNDHENFTYLIYLYLCGAYLRKYYAEILDHNCNPKKYFLRFLLCYGFIFLTMILFEYVSNYNTLFTQYIKTYIAINRIPAFLSGIYLFLAFKTLKVKMSTWINKIASMTLGVYLFHDHPLMRNVLWNRIFPTYKLYYSKVFILYTVGIILLIFVIGIILEWIRRLILQIRVIRKVESSLEEKFIQLCSCDISKLWNQVFERLFLN